MLHSDVCKHSCRPPWLYEHICVGMYINSVHSWYAFTHGNAGWQASPPMRVCIPACHQHALLGHVNSMFV